MGVFKLDRYKLSAVTPEEEERITKTGERVGSIYVLLSIVPKYNPEFCSLLM